MRLCKKGEYSDGTRCTLLKHINYKYIRIIK